MAEKYQWLVTGCGVADATISFPRCESTNICYEKRRVSGAQ
jgi:hypothetical protein